MTRGDNGAVHHPIGHLCTDIICHDRKIGILSDGHGLILLSCVKCIGSFVCGKRKRESLKLTLRSGDLCI